MRESEGDTLGNSKLELRESSILREKRIFLAMSMKKIGLRTYPDLAKSFFFFLTNRCGEVVFH